MAWSAGVFLVPRNLVAVFGYAFALVAVGPAIATQRQLLGPVLVAVALLGTAVYARYGLLVLTARCEACGESHHVGSLWCPRVGTVRTAVDRPVVQACLAVGLFVLVGFVANAARTFALWIAIRDGPLYRYLLTDGDALFRAVFLAGGMVAAVPVPVLVGNLFRYALLKTTAFPTRRS